MCADKLDKEKLKKLWKKKTDQLFTDFANEQLGGGGQYPQKEPACFGSGDAESYCAFCSFRAGC